MKILVLNCGSSSLKYQLIDMDTETVITKGTYERIGMNNSFITIKQDGDKIRIEHPVNNHEKALKFVFEDLLMGEEYGKIKSLEEIDAIGHRIVHGGEKFTKAVLINDEVIESIKEVIPLAPLHNPPALLGIEACRSVVPNMPMAAIFDTAFHQTMPKENYLYALPMNLYHDYKVRRYGAHGTSHRYVAKRANEILGKENTKLITCHIGNGASVSAILNGKCLNTSMGLTPNAGLIMGTRCGDIDASIIPYIMEKMNLTPKQVDELINKKSGLLAISEKSSDSRDIEDGIANGDEKCILAQKMYVRRIVDYIAKYYVEMKGCDAIIFTAGIGEKAIDTRRDIINELDILGIYLDEEANNVKGKEKLISTKDSKIACYIIPTDEELMIAKDTYELV